MRLQKEEGENYMGDNYIVREEFEQYKREVDKRFEKLHSENRQVLIEIAKISERMGNVNEKITGLKTSIDEKLDSVKGDIQVIQNGFMDNLKEPRDRLLDLKWGIVGAICSACVGAVLALIIK